MVVVDTKVLAYFLLGEPAHRDEAARSLEKMREIWAPDSIRAELLSVVWQWTRGRRVALSSAIGILRDAVALLSGVVPAAALWEDALELGVLKNHSTYDALFVALAAQTGTRVVTYDQALIEKFPELCIDVSAYVDG